jgi:excisionase family DNA binding protein
MDALAIKRPESVELVPNETDQRLAREGSKVLKEHLGAGKSGTLKLVDDGIETEIRVPASVLLYLEEILSHLGRGQSVTVLPLDVELTTQQAADLLNVSRPYLITLLEEEKAIPFRMVGKHRRIRLLDALAYKRKFIEERKEILRELAAQAQELEMRYGA